MNLISFGIFGIIFLSMITIVSSQSPESIDNIEEEMFLMNCPFPIYNGDVTDLNIDGFSVTFNVTRYDSLTAFNGTFFECSIDGITGAFTVSASSEEYDATLFSVIPIGYFGFLADYITSLFDRIVHFFTLIAFFVTPLGFNILGYSIDDLSGAGLFFVIAIYALCYIGVFAFIYTIVIGIVGAFT